MDTQNGSLVGKHVLVVDDDLQLALTYQALLQVHGFEASTAENGTQALKVVMSQQVDAILCDLSMPELAGDLFYVEVGRARPQLLKRFIFVTGNAENPLYDSFLKSIKAPVVYKPVSFASLLTHLRRLLQAEAQPSTSVPAVGATPTAAQSRAGATL